MTLKVSYKLILNPLPVRKQCFTWCSFTRFGEQGKVLLLCSGVLLELLDFVGIGGGTKSLGISYHLSSFECPLEELVSVPCIKIYITV